MYCYVHNNIKTLIIVVCTLTATIAIPTFVVPIIDIVFNNVFKTV